MFLILIFKGNNPPCGLIYFLIKSKLKNAECRTWNATQLSSRNSDYNFHLKHPTSNYSPQTQASSRPFSHPCLF